MSNRVESESIQPTSSASRWSSQNALVREWWDPEKRAKYSRPGPCLPPLAAYEKFHNANHTLLKVRITAPRDEDVADCRIGTVISLQDGFVIPSDTEVQSAIPHSSAAYCLEENGWIILEIRASKTLPKFSRLAASAVLPDEVRHQRNTTCRAPETHHLRQYDNAADGSILDIPYSPTKWTAKHSNLMNVFICSRCATYAVVSAEIIPGVIPVAILDAYIKERSDKPQAGYSPQSMVARALRSVLRLVLSRPFSPRADIQRRVHPESSRITSGKGSTDQSSLRAGSSHIASGGVSSRAWSIFIISPWITHELLL